MKTALKCIAAMTLSGMLTGCGGGAAHYPDGSAAALKERLAQAVSEGRYFYAHQDDIVYGHAWKVTDAENDGLERSDVKAVCGDFPAIVGFDLGGIELGNAKNLDDVPFALMRKAAVKHVERGGMVTFSWHPRNPLTGGDSWDVSVGRAVASVLEGGEKHGLFMQWLARTGDFFCSLKDAEGRLIPVIFRPWHENIGSWFWWGGNLCSEEEYKALYALTYNYLVKTRNLTNILWVYSPDSMVDEEQYMSRYPGDGMVDILGIDHYSYIANAAAEPATEILQQAKDNYMQILMRNLQYMTRLGIGHGKLIAMTETGFESIPDPCWWTDVLKPCLDRFPVAYVLTWRNACDKPAHYYAPFPGSRDAENFKAFHDAEETIFLHK